MLILTDIDETCFQWSCQFQKWIEDNGYRTTGNLRETHSVENLIGVSRDEASALINEFNMSGALKQQKPEPDAVEVLPALYKDGWRFVAITACGTSTELRSERKGTLETIFGFPWTVHTVELHATKRDVLKTFDPAIWVEDNLWHATEGASLGHRSFLLDRDYNQNIDDDYPVYERVANWHEIAKLI